MSELLEMRGIEIQFPGVKALDKVDFTLRAGEVHALLGENGAGKSTLIKCLTGVNKMDAGEIRLEGKPIRPTSPQAAIEMGISTVFQEINLDVYKRQEENVKASYESGVLHLLVPKQEAPKLPEKKTIQSEG